MDNIKSEQGRQILVQFRLRRQVKKCESWEEDDLGV